MTKEDYNARLYPDISAWERVPVSQPARTIRSMLKRNQRKMDGQDVCCWHHMRTTAACFITWMNYSKFTLVTPIIASRHNTVIKELNEILEDIFCLYRFQPDDDWQKLIYCLTCAGRLDLATIPTVMPHPRTTLRHGNRINHIAGDNWEVLGFKGRTTYESDNGKHITMERRESANLQSFMESYYEERTHTHRSNRTRNQLRRFNATSHRITNPDIDS